MSVSRTKRRRIKWNIPLTLMCMPAVIIIFVYRYLPIAGITIAFKDFRYDLGFLGSEWVGFKNFRFFFTSNDAWRVLRNTVGLNMLFIILGLITSVLVALLLNELRNRTVVKSLQTMMFFPYFLSWVVASYVLFAFLNHKYGILNTTMEILGMKGIAWYREPKYWPFILAFMYLWKSVGYTSVIYYAGLMGINKDYYDAASVDGANKLQKMWHVSLPSIMPLITILTILAIGRILYADFGLFFQLTRDQGILYRTTDVLDTYVYRTLRVTGDIGMSSAIGFFQAVVGFILILSTNAIVRRFSNDNALF